MFDAYGLTKAIVHKYTEISARENPNLLVNSVTPGFCNTNLTEGLGAPMTAEAGTKALLHMLFADIKETGWYFGEDGQRNPLHVMRNAGKPAFKGY